MSAQMEVWERSYYLKTDAGDSVSLNRQMTYYITNPVFMNNNAVDIIDTLDVWQFKNFCSTFFASLGISNVESVLQGGCGWIVGKGTIELGALMSYHFAFFGVQHSGTLPDTIINELRDTMDGQTNKGLLLTTGYFSREVKRQAKSKGKIPVDLIDAKDLIYRLRSNSLEVSMQTGEVFKANKQGEL